MCMILLCHSCSGFTGFELTYSNPKENISVNLSAQSGSILLSPVAMQFGQVMWSKLTIYSGNETTTSLIIEGSVEVINFALQSIQYLGYFSFIYIYIYLLCLNLLKQCSCLENFVHSSDTERKYLCISASWNCTAL